PLRAVYPGLPAPIVDLAQDQKARLFVTRQQLDSTRLVVCDPSLGPGADSGLRQRNRSPAEIFLLEERHLRRIERCAIGKRALFDRPQHFTPRQSQRLLYEPGSRHGFEVLVEINLSETRQSEPSLR